LESDDILYVCITCKKNGVAVEPRPGKVLYENLKRTSASKNIKPVRCLAGCSQGCVLSLNNKRKWSYVIGNLTPNQDEEQIIKGFTEYKNTSDGKIPFSRRPEAFKKRSLARVPPENYEVVEDE
jgi:predicted metal-binding protein